MVPQQQKVLCRAGFVLLCILPTVVQLWALLAPAVVSTMAAWRTTPVGPAVNQTDPSGDSDSEGAQAELKRDSHGVIFSWSQKQGLDLSDRPMAGQCNLQKTELPESHPLRSFPFSSLTITETSREVILAVQGTTLSQVYCHQVYKSLLAGKYDAWLPTDRKLLIRIEQLIIRRYDGDNIEPALLRDVEIECNRLDRTLTVSGRRINGEDFGAAVPEFPFRWLTDFSKEKKSLQLVGNSVPVWLLGHGFSDILGPTAELDGDYRATSLPGRSPSVQFQGLIRNVSCESLTAWLEPQGLSLASGTCQIQCDQFLTDENSVRSFAGELQSVSSGNVASGIVRLLENQGRWAAASTGPAPYRSFLFGVDYRDGQLELKSKYEGNQLIWTSDGSGIVILN